MKACPERWSARERPLKEGSGADVPGVEGTRLAGHGRSHSSASVGISSKKPKTCLWKGWRGFLKLATLGESVSRLALGNRDYRKAFRVEVFGKLLMSTVRRSDSADTELLRDLRPGTALRAEHGNLANVHDNVRSDRTFRLPLGFSSVLPNLSA